MAAQKEIPKPYSVSGLTAELKATLEAKYTRIYVEAEISGWRLYPSGHAYFTLKDSGAQISAVMFASSLARCKVKGALKDGAKVLVYGNVSVYAPRGNYQLMVLAAKLVGEGDLMQKYLELKAKLEKEGLFDAARKHSTNALVSSVTPSPTGENEERLITADARRRRFIAQTFYSSLRVLDDGLPPPR